ncbi:Malonyl-CoA O-methyltransferase BioC [Rickettsiales bacterium Ac37b]|nr:Malonyl-CoA O-methyltransferase BioC [Rickettsiales bacterium Ac37b]
MLQKSLIKQSFDRSAFQYDSYAGLQKEIANELLAIFFKGDRSINMKPFNILDLGCGTGYLLERFIESVNVVNFTQLDLSFNMCKVAAERNGVVSTVNGDIEQLPFDKETFDMVVSSSTFQWLEDINIGLKEVLRVLKPRGIIAFATFGYNTLKELRQIFALIDNGKHVNDFLQGDIIQNIMQNLGFTEFQVIKRTKIQHFVNLLEIMRYLRNLGASYKGNSKQQALFSKAKLDKLNSLYKKNFSDIHGLITSWEIYYFLALKP